VTKAFSSLTMFQMELVSPQQKWSQQFLKKHGDLLVEIRRLVVVANEFPPELVHWLSVNSDGG